MIKHFLTVIYRNFLRSKGYFMINVAGLALAWYEQVSRKRRELVSSHGKPAVLRQLDDDYVDPWYPRRKSKD